MGFGSGLGSIPFLEIGVVLVVTIGVLFAWRKGILARILNRIRNRGRE